LAFSLLHCRAEAQRSAKQLVQLEKEREKYSLEASEANARYMQVTRRTIGKQLAGGTGMSAALRGSCTLLLCQHCCQFRASH
jgi:hypothetical protein